MNRNSAKENSSADVETPPSVEILVVDDDPSSLRTLTDMLEKAGYRVRSTGDPETGLNAALTEPPRLIVLDTRMPGMDGFELCRRLQADPRTSEIPIIFAVDHQHVEDRVRCFVEGGTEFISRPYVEAEVLGRVSVHFQLIESLASLDEAQKLARVGSWSWKVATDRVSWTKLMYEIAGLDPNKPAPSFHEDLAPLYTADSWEKLSQAVERALKDGQSYELELDMVRPDGSVCHTSTCGDVAIDVDGRVVRLFGTVQDITERKQAENSHKQSDEYLRGLIEQTPLAIEVHSVDGKFLMSNPAYSRITGLHGAELQAVKESYDLRQDEQIHRQGFGPLLERLYAGEAVEFPAHTYSVAEEANSLGLGALDGDSARLRAFGFPIKNSSGRTEAVVVMTEDITEQEKTDEKLEILRAYADHLIDQSPVSIQVHDIDGKLLRWNTAYAKLYGLNDEAMAVLSEKYNVREDEQAEELGAKPFIERVYQGESVLFPPYEYDGIDTLKTLDLKNPISRQCWVQTRGFPLRDKKGNITSAVFWSEDITERKQAEEKLGDLRAYTDHLIESASVMIVSLDTQGRVTRFNPAAETITGYTLAEVEGKDWFELLVPRERYPEVRAAFEGLVGGGAPRVLENPIYTKAGEKRYISWTNSEVTKSGAIAGVISFGVDITERKEVEEALRESEEKFHQMLAQSPLSIQILNPAGHLEEVNQAWMDLWGVKEEELEALKASWCILEDEQVKELGLMPLVERAFRGERVDLPDINYDAGSTFDDAGLPIAGAQKRWVRAHLYAVRNEKGKIVHVVDVEEDITEAKRAELKLQDYQERLRALALELTISEERERRRIAAELHDNAAQSLALARLRLAAIARRVTDERAVGQLDDLSQLLRDSLQQIRNLVLDLSSPALNEIGLGAAIVEWSENQLRSRHGLQFWFDNACDHLEIDEVVASVLFRNTRELLSNVVKHAGAGRVVVRLQCVDDELHITVTDDGCGFSTAEVARRPTGEGGFGLFSIRERMADLGGRLDVESAPGGGCTAVLRMPLDRTIGKD